MRFKKKERDEKSRAAKVRVQLDQSAYRFHSHLIAAKYKKTS